MAGKTANLADSQRAIVNAYTAIALVYCAASVWLYLRPEGDRDLAWVHAFSFAVIATNYLVLRRTQNYAIATHGILFIGTLVVGSQFLTGGYQGTGPLWTFAYLPYAFFLASTAVAAFWVAVLVALYLAFVFLHHTGHIIHLPYLDIGLWVYFASLGIFLLCMFLFKATVLRSERLAERRAAELAETNLQLEAARIAAEEATKAKSQFLATMSHEVRTPMNAVIGLTEVLRAKPQDAENADILRILHESGEHLLTVINDILDYSKIEAGKVELEEVPLDVRRLLEGCVSLINVRAAEKHLALDVGADADVPEAIWGDPGRLRQVLLNLLSNAVKFTPHGSVTLRASRQDDRLAFRVIDTGVGIPQERFDRLFQSFSQVDASTTRVYGGTGLGLAISARLVGLMGGNIHVASQVGKGSTFSFDIPLRSAPSVAAAAADLAGALDREAVARAAPSLKILLAEDNSINQKVAQRLLAQLGAHAEMVDDGVKAADAALQRPYDIILMDLQMPGLDGVAATKRIRTGAHAGTRPYIIALTADALPGDRERCLEAGMDDYVAKPIHLAALTAALARSLAAKKRRA